VLGDDEHEGQRTAEADWWASAAPRRLRRRRAGDRHAPLGTNSESRARAVAIRWRDHASRDFLSAYVEAMKGAPNYPDNEATAAGLLDLFLLKKAFNEISYETAYRPHWSSIPVRGVLDSLERREALRDGSSAFRAL
jgi:predicted trehalose synthase